MTLATRCTACGTTFKVVQDQLKVSGGWVRCGRCSEVFNAIDGLFEVGSPMAAAAAEPEPTVGAAPPAAAEARLHVEPAAAGAPGSSSAPPFGLASAPSDGATVEASGEGSVGGPIEAPAEASPEASIGASTEVPLVPPAPTRADYPGEAAAEAPFEPFVETPMQAGAAPVDAIALPDEVPERAPTFLRNAERAERWRRPGVRLALAAAALGLALLLVWQVAITWRDTIATRWPDARPLLAEACAWTGCSVEPLRRIDALAIDSSGLVQVPGTQIYRLAVVLRNRAELELMLPAFELTLTDSQGEIVVRRVITAAELGSTSRTIAATSELSLEASLNPGDRRISGYTIKVFYP